MATRRRSSYQAREDRNSMEALTAKLGADLRLHIRQLGSYPMLGPQWCEMADSLARLGNISDMEASLPKTDQKETLWEGEEMALRAVMEDGKLNLCLRGLAELSKYKSKLYRGTVDNGEGKEGERKGETKCVEEPMRLTMDKFEKGMGRMMNNAWSHVEALQITDLPLMVEHVTDILAEAAQDTDRMASLHALGDLSERQEVLCLHYLLRFLSQLDELSEDRLMPIIRRQGTFSIVVRMLSSSHRWLTDDALTTGAAALSLLCATEDFGTYSEDHCPLSCCGMVGDLKEQFLSRLCKDFETKRKLRPLLDFTNACARRQSKGSLHE